MPKTITLDLRPDDAEPILRDAAERAARFGAYCDHITRRTVEGPASGNYDDCRKQWLARFLAAKRVVEAFGVEIEPTSEPETLTVYYSHIGGRRKLKNIGGVRFNVVTGSKPDYKNPYPCYRRDVHAEACRQAASRVVRRWRETLRDQAAA